VFTHAQQQDTYPESLGSLHYKLFRASVVRHLQNSAQTHSSSDVFRKRFEELSYEMMLPMGARMEHLRKLATKYTRIEASVLIQDELGMRTHSLLHWLLTEKTKYEIAMDATHLLHAVMLLAMLTYELKEYKVAFFNRYFVQASQVYSKLETRLEVTEIQYRKARPIVVNLKRRWWVLYDKKLFECSADFTQGLIDAMTTWCVLVHAQFDCTLEDDANITEWMKETLFDTSDTQSHRNRRKRYRQ
jgi:hypothetical protein